MFGLKHSLKGSTLIETLVMMLVAGIIFLCVMDGLTLFTRMQIQRTEALLAAGREANGYHRIAALIANADSVGRYAEDIELFRDGSRSALRLCDSALIFSSGAFSDTLMIRVGGLHLCQYDRQADTIEIALSPGFTAKFPVLESPQEYHQRSIEQIEYNYGYPEE